MLDDLDQLHRLATATASDTYATVVFNTESFYNRPAPDPIVAFIIGAALSAVTLVYWLFLRWLPIRRRLKTEVTNPPSTLKLRTLISTWADNDDPFFTILRLTAQSMLYLAGFQLNYQLTFSVMLAYFGAISFSDSLRVIMSLGEATRLEDLNFASKRDKAALANALKARKDGKSMIQLSTSNVYEDISRNFSIVLMVFVTQCILISFVCVDIFNTSTMSVLDGTNNVPIVGTLGSWLVYCLGIFMQAVYILGPKSNFGTSEQNPTFWLQLMISAKGYGAECKWADKVDDVEKTVGLRPGSPMLWIRFIMSFLINGVGYHILVHALPIQVAGQSGLTGIVFRAVGMIYLVDLDDAPGTVLTLSEASKGEIVGKALEDTPNGSPKSSTQLGDTSAQELIDEARAKADALQLQLQKDLDELAAKHVKADNTV